MRTVTTPVLVHYLGGQDTNGSLSTLCNQVLVALRDGIKRTMIYWPDVGDEAKAVTCLWCLAGREWSDIGF